MKKLLTNDIVVRALKTFTQTFLAVAAAGVADVTDITAAKALVVSAGAAAISAVWNTIVLAKK